MVEAYKSVRQLVLQRIENQDYALGSQVDSFRALARSTGTSTIAVYRALTQLVSEGYLRNEPRRGYFVTRPSSGGNAQRAGTVGLLVCRPQQAGDLSSDFRDVMTTVQTNFMRKERSILVLGALVSGTAPKVYMSPEAVVERQLEGVLTYAIYDLPYLASLAAVQRNVVALDVDSSDVAVNSVSFDNLAAGCELVRRLYARGARRIAFMGGPFPPPTPDMPGVIYDPAARERFDGWRLGMQLSGLSPDEELVFLAQYRDNREVGAFIAGSLRKSAPPDAIVTEFPDGVCAALDANGVKPGAIPVACWSDSSAAAGWPAAVGCGALCDFKELAKQGAEVLAQRMEKPGPKAERRRIPLPIVERFAPASDA